MRSTNETPTTRRGRRMPSVRRALIAGCVAASILLGTLALTGAGAGAAPPSVVLHYFQKTTVVTFYNASGVVIQGYPPVGGHVREDDVDYVGSHSHHAKQWTVSDHLYCTVVSAPANADCFGEFSTGNSLIYLDDVAVNLASANGTMAIDGGTGRFSGDSGTLASTAVGNNSDLVLTLHKG
jgi:hypothetical protein